MRDSTGAARVGGWGICPPLATAAPGVWPFGHRSAVKFPRPSPKKWAAVVYGRRPRLSLGTWAALGFVGLASLAGLVSWGTDALDDWAPNVAVDSLALAATIVIVERIVRREARERLRPRVESAMQALRQEFRGFVSAVTVDYAGTHLHTFRPLPRNALAFLDQWLADKGAQDACQTMMWDRLTLVLHQGNQLGKALRHYRELDRDVLEPEVVRAIDDYLWLGLQWASTSLGLARSGYTRRTLGEGYASAETIIVEQARAFGEVLARHDPHGSIELDDLTLSATQLHSEGLLKRAEELVGWRWFPRERAADRDAPAPKEQGSNSHLADPPSAS